MKIAYIRTSSVQQNLDVQRETVTKFGVDKIFEEQVSGASTDNREQLKQALDFVRDGDELVVTRIDRLARSVRDLQNIVHELEQKNVKLVCTEPVLVADKKHRNSKRRGLSGVSLCNLFHLSRTPIIIDTLSNACLMH